MIYCDFDYMNYSFNNKKVYKCKYCGTTLALENPDANIICFKRQNAMFDELDNMYRKKEDQINSQFLKTNNPSEMEELARSDFMRASKQVGGEKITINNENHPSNLCSKEEIDRRLSICQGCEYYKDDACMLCGCTVVREANFNNKLAHKDKACPINKWGPIAPS